jgi:FAD synthase
MKEVMNFKVVPYDAKTIEIQKLKVDTFRKDDVVIIKVPNDVQPKDVQEFVSKIKIAFPNESLVIVGQDVEFAKLVELDG